MESKAWDEAENKAPPIWRWGDEKVVVIFTEGFGNSKLEKMLK